MKNLILLSIFFITNTILISQHNQYAYLGVRSNQVDEEKAAKLNFEVAHGAYLTTVIPNTAAKTAGLAPFDYIYRIGEYDLTEDMSLGKIMKQYQPNDEVTIYYVRSGNKEQKSVKLGSNWDNESYHRSNDEDPFLGVHQSHNNNEEIDGVQVNVSSNSTAEDIGMQDGDIVTRIDDIPIIDWHDLAAAINNRTAGDNIAVTVWRDGDEYTYSGPIKPESASHNSNWSWDWDWKWTWDKSRKHDSKDMDIEDMDAEVEEMPVEEVEAVMEETGLDMPTVNNLTIEQIEVFPNPSVGMFTLNFDLPQPGDSRIRIYSATGRLVFSRNLGQFQGRFTENLDIAGAGPGVYYLMIQQNDFAVTRKIIIARS